MKPKPRWRGKRLEIIEAAPLPEKGIFTLGQVVALSQEGAASGVTTGEGILGVVKVQFEGKRVMPAIEFIRGQRQFIGATLPLS